MRISMNIRNLCGEGGGVEYKHEREPSAYTYAFVAVMFSEDIVSIIIKCSLIG